MVLVFLINGGFRASVVVQGWAFFFFVKRVGQFFTALTLKDNGWVRLFVFGET